MIQKAIAYITRHGNDGRRELLVFEHRDYPDAGVQVPAGTIESGEPPEVAVLREVFEETGLADCRIVRKLAKYNWHNPDTGQVNERHVFHLAAPERTEDEWVWVETDGGRVSELEGYVFLFRWVGLAAPIRLAGGLDDYLHEIGG